MQKRFFGDILKLNLSALSFVDNIPYSIYILDFYCHSLQLIIEVDGSIHDLPDVKLNDEQRQTLFEKDGLIVLRFTNDQIEKNFDEAKKEIEIFLIKH